MNTYYVSITGNKGFNATHQLKAETFVFAYLDALAILNRYQEDCALTERLDIISLTKV